VADQHQAEPAVQIGWLCHPIAGTKCLTRNAGSWPLVNAVISGIKRTLQRKSTGTFGLNTLTDVLERSAQEFWPECLTEKELGDFRGP
jgi:hypothetical protein